MRLAEAHRLLAPSRGRLSEAWARMRLTGAVRLRLYRRLASLSRAGMPLPRALDAVWQVAAAGGRAAGGPAARAVADWRCRVYDGHPFGRALEGWVPEREWLVLEAGTGDLAQALDDAAGLIVASQRMTAAVSTALGYPLFLCGLLAVLLWIFSVDAIPAFAEVRPMESWTGMAAAMGVLARAVHAGLLLLLALAGATLAAALWSLPRWTGPWRQRADRWPPWSFYRLVMGTGFLTALVALLRTGMPIPEALRRLRARACPWLAERLDAALFFVNSGHDLGEALHRAGHGFPAVDIVEDLRVFALLGDLDGALARLAAEWVAQSLDALRAAGDGLKVLGMALVAATIAWIQLGIIAIQQQLTAGF
jgi:type II secretory pathway component PulF